MNLKRIVCTQCGRSMEIDPERQTAKCRACGEEFLVETGEMLAMAEFRNELNELKELVMNRNSIEKERAILYLDGAKEVAEKYHLKEVSEKIQEGFKLLEKRCDPKEVVQMVQTESEVFVIELERKLVRKFLNDVKVIAEEGEKIGGLLEKVNEGFGLLDQSDDPMEIVKTIQEYLEVARTQLGNQRKTIEKEKAENDWKIALAEMLDSFLEYVQLSAAAKEDPAEIEDAVRIIEGITQCYKMLNSEDCNLDEVSKKIESLIEAYGA